jgi:uncharacterized damage-inducible protein DinB
MQNTFLVSLFEHKAWCNRELIEALRAAPDDVDRMGMAIALLTLEHTALVDQAFKARLCGDEPSFTSVVGSRPPKVDDLGARMSETDAWYLDYAGRVSPEELETLITFKFISDDDEGCMTKGQILAHVITHSAAHRGAIGKMLETLNVRGASDMVTTFYSQS